MSNTMTPFYAVMEGKGAYNRNAKLPAAGAAVALPLLEKAVLRVGLGSEKQPFVIADYGSTQGKNSMASMHSAIQGLRRRIGPDRAISVIHIDQPSNDFNTLFAVLDADPERYVADDSNVFPAAVGRSFYQSVLPPSSSILDGPLMRQCGLAASQRSFPTTSFPPTAQAPCEPNSIVRRQMTGKTSCRCAQRNYVREGTWSSCSRGSPMMDRRGSRTSWMKPMQHSKKWWRMARLRRRSAREWWCQHILGGNPISWLPSQITGISSS